MNNYNDYIQNNQSLQNDGYNSPNYEQNNFQNMQNCNSQIPNNNDFNSNYNQYNDPYFNPNNPYYQMEKADIKPLIFGILGFSGLIFALLGYAFAIPDLIISISGRKNPANSYNNAGIILSSIALAVTFINSVLGVIMILSQNL